MKKVTTSLLLSLMAFCLLPAQSQDSKNSSEEELFLQNRPEFINLNVQNAVGESFHRGDSGFPKNEEQAFLWFRKTACKGHAISQYNLGVCYLFGKGTTTNKDSAFHWFHTAALQEVETAQYNLTLCYLFGEGTERDISKAIGLHRKINPQKDSIESARWATEITMLSETSHSLYYGIIPRRSVQNALRYMKIQNAIGEAFYKGFLGFPEDQQRAIHWFRRAASRNYAEAQFNLGVCFFFGDGVTLNKDSAVHWFQAAAEKGLAKAQCNLALCYYFGDGIKKNDTLAANLYREAAKQGADKAQNNLGYFYEFGIGIKQNSKRAEHYYKRAARIGNADAQFNLASFLYDEDTHSSRKKAIGWWKKAAGQGHIRSLKILENLKNGSPYQKQSILAQ